MLAARIKAIDGALKVPGPSILTRHEAIDRPVAALAKTAKALDRVAKAAAADVRRHEASAGLFGRLRPAWRRDRTTLAERAAITADAARRAHLVANAERSHLSAIYPHRQAAALAIRQESDARRDSMRADRIVFASALARVRSGDRVALAVSQQALASVDPSDTLRRGFTPPRQAPPRPAPKKEPEAEHDNAEELGLRHVQKYVPSWAHGPQKADKKQEEKRR